MKPTQSNPRPMGMRKWMGLLLFPAFAQALILPLTVKEHHGIGRDNEPVVTGVPLPKGAYMDATKFRVRGVQSFQINPLVQWPDGSIRWLQVQFPASVSAHGSATYQLADDHSGSAPSTSLSVTESAGHVTVATGPLIFKIKKTGGFNLFDEVTLDGHSIVAPSAENGLRIRASHQNLLYASSGEDSGYTVSVLEKGPLRACIRVEGHHGNASANEHGFYNYTCYIYAYAGRSHVLVSHVLGNTPYWLPRGPLKFTDLDLRTKVSLNGPKTVTLFGAAKATAGMGAQASLVQSAVDAYSSTLGNGTKALGWLDISDGQRGLAVGVKHFWEYFPKALEADSGGLIDVSLFPAQANTTYYIQDQTNKEHQVMYYFHKGSADAGGVQAVMGGMLNHRLVPTTSRKWYSATRAVLGDLAESRTALEHPKLPVINDHVGHATRNREGWYTWGYDTYNNNDNSRELFHNESINFLQTLHPTDYLILEAATRIEGHKHYQLHRDFKTLSLFHTRGTGTNPGNLGHKDYYGTPSDPRLRNQAADPIHWGAGTIGQLKGWVTYPNGWIVHNTEHMDIKHVLDLYCLTGDYYLKDIIRSAGEFRGTFPVIHLNSFFSGNEETNFSRAIAASAYNMAAYYMVSPTSENKAIMEKIGQYWVRAPGTDGYIGLVQDRFSPFQEAMAVHTGGLLYDVSSIPAFKTALEGNIKIWYSLLNTQGFVPYAGIISTGDASAAATSMYRVVDGMMSFVQHFTGHEELHRRVKLLENAKNWGSGEPYLQKFYLAADHASEFNQNPFPSVMTTLKDTMAWTSVRRNVALQFEGKSLLQRHKNYFTYVVPSRQGRLFAVDLNIFDSSGRRVFQLIRRRKLATGTYFAQWDGLDSLRNPLPAGKYYAVLELDRKPAEKVPLTITP